MKLRCYRGYPRDELPVTGDEPGPFGLDARETLRAAWADVAAAIPAPVVAARFHNGVANGRSRACPARAFRVLIPERLSPNDGGISYGQAAIAAART